MKSINLRIFGTNALIYCKIILSKIDKDHLNIFYLKLILAKNIYLSFLH